LPLCSMCQGNRYDGVSGYGVALVSRLDKVLGLFCKRA